MLIHSPLVGPLTWSRVAAELLARGRNVLVPVLDDSSGSGVPYWMQHAKSVSKSVAAMPIHTSMTLVAHSGAGPLLPAIRQKLPNPVHAYVFVDAGIPRDGATRLDLMRSEDPDWAFQFQQKLEQGGQFPDWSFDDLQEAIPEAELRRQMIAEIRPRGLSFFTEPIPVFAGWPDAPCVYIRLSAPYDRPALQARRSGWVTHTLQAGHFHMLVDAKAITDLIVDSAEGIGRGLA